LLAKLTSVLIKLFGVSEWDDSHVWNHPSASWPSGDFAQNEKFIFVFARRQTVTSLELIVAV